MVMTIFSFVAHPLPYMKASPMPGKEAGNGMDDFFNHRLSLLHPGSGLVGRPEPFGTAGPGGFASDRADETGPGRDQ